MKLNNNVQKPSINNQIKQVEKKEKKDNEKLSSGKKINSASDDPAGLAMSQKLSALIAGIGKGVNNTYDMQNAIKVADGALGSINDSLSRVRELSIQASSSILSDSDREIIQQEINATLEGINDIANNTQFNGQNLLDGSFKDKNVAMNGDGSGTTISIGAVTTEALGLEGFDVTSGKVDLEALDKAINSVTSGRVQLGAQINRFDHVIASNQNTSLNLIAANSKIEDTDMAKATIDMKTNQALIQYGIFAQQSKAQTKYNMLSILF